MGHSTPAPDSSFESSPSPSSPSPESPSSGSPSGSPGSAEASHDAELVAEQAHLDRAYAYLEDARRAAEAVARGFEEVGVGGLHQTRVEREAAEAHTARRLAQYSFGDLPLCFGRLDMAVPARVSSANDDGSNNRQPLAPERFYIGRVAVFTPEQEPMVIDWRAPVAEPFYRATAAASMNVVRRRQFLCRGRQLLRIDDEVFDVTGASDAGLAVRGEAVLIAALDRARTGRMHDIVATIQAEQDDAIRSSLAGVLVVQGGPGTGKTAVALHRAAYLLYTHRQQLIGRGVLLVGPSPVFLRYIEHVLPSLGETGVQLTTVAGLGRFRVKGKESAAVSALKGDARMARLVRRAIDDRQRPLRRDIVVSYRDQRLVLSAETSRRVVAEARRRHGTHNQRHRFVASRFVESLLSQHVAAVQRMARLGLLPPVDEDDDAWPAHDRDSIALDDDEVSQTYEAAVTSLRNGVVPPWYRNEFERTVLRTTEMREALFRTWPNLAPDELIHDLFGSNTLLQRAARDILSQADTTLLFRPRSATRDEVAWTEADLPLLEEAGVGLGPLASLRPNKKSGRNRSDSGERRAHDVWWESIGGGIRPTEVPAANTEEPPEFDHILVDEAQDLTPMQWRMLARRSPTASMTLVGDFGQSSRPGACRDWEQALSHLSTRRGLKRVELTINYRTPAEIVTLANRVLAVAAPSVTPTRAVRSTGEEPSVQRVEPSQVVDVVARLAGAASAGEGTVAVLAPVGLLQPIVEALRSFGASASTVDALDAPIAVLPIEESKGLEFDAVIVVEPAQLVDEPSSSHQAGLRRLFVGLTRATKQLTIVHSERLPEGLEP